MYTFMVVLHIIVCLFLIFIILIQSSKGAEMGAAFGGSNQTLFGSRGATTVMSKLTTAAAIMFMITSLTLAVVTVRKGSVMSSVPIQEPASKSATAGPIEGEVQPAAPGQGEVQGTPVEPATEPAK
ncbi:MAG: preprotein translocase subunit SecG [Nitrospira sp.]|nr:preprotein translocase subunit SecG [Nitrospira sp.]